MPRGVSNTVARHRIAVMTIRSKLTLCFLATVVMPTMLLTHIVDGATLTMSQEDFAHRAVQRMRFLDTNSLNIFDIVKGEIRHLASDPVYQVVADNLSTFREGPPKASDWRNTTGVERQIGEMLERFAENRPYILAAYFGSTFGGFVGHGTGQLENYDPQLRPWYRAAIASRAEPTITDLYISPGFRPLISVAYPVVRPDGSLIGVQSLDLTLDWLTSLVESTELGETGYMMLIDGNGVILANPVEPEHLSVNISEIDQPLYRGLADLSQHQFSTIQDGTLKDVVSYRSPQTGWRYVAVVDNSEILAPVVSLNNKIWLIALAMAGAFAALGIFFATRITSPIEHVSESLDRIANNETDELCDLKINSSDEIGQLALRFNKVLRFARDNQQERLRAQKLEAIGQLAAGIAHEINTPSQYVSDNVAFLSDAVGELTPVLDCFPDMIAQLRTSGVGGNEVRRFEDIAEAADLPFLKEEIPTAVNQAREGLAQITKIVRAMKEFSHPGDEAQMINLNDALQSTATVARNEWKYLADLEFDLDEKLHLVECIPSIINQAFLNLIVNAAHAIDENRSENSLALGKISIRTRQLDEGVKIQISDTGSGIPPEIIDRIFDPFFSTKEVGKGTGQGLTLVHDAIVNKHRGSLRVKSIVGTGTTFFLRIPLAFRSDQRKVSAAA